MEQITLEVYTDFICPWCYLGRERINKLKANYPVHIQWKYFPLHPGIPQEGITLKDLFPGKNFEDSPMAKRLKSLIDEEGLPYNSPSMTFNTRLAQELAKWADDFPEGEALHSALYRACFVEERNIGEINELLQLVEKVGLPIEEAQNVLEHRFFQAKIDTEWQEARERGVTGVPTVIAPPYIIVGAQPYEKLVEMIQRIRSEENN